MEIISLKIKNFRNFSDLELNFKPEGALIHGINGIGKTNILEAISFFAFGKSFQTSYDLELIHFSKAFFRIEGKFLYNGHKHFLEAAADKSKKFIKIDGAGISRISELYQHVKVVYFSPDDINIVGGAPSFRRKFIDQAISQYSYRYIGLLRKFYRILKQRNALLKTEFDRKEKKTWDEQFVSSASQVINFRLEYLKEFTPILMKYYSHICEKNEELGICYKYSFPTSGKIEDDLLDHLNEIEEQEIIQERSLAGPHIDDLDFTINKHSARKFGSQGEKRSLAITARLVQANLIAQVGDDTPILIFDDVLSDLDKKRAKKIISLLENKHQVFIATPNVTIYKDFKLEKINMEKIIKESQAVDEVQ